MIEVENLVKTYRDVRALDGLTLRVPKGVVYGFLGPNGAGKSTTIMSLLGLVIPQEGKISLFGEEVFRDGRFDEGRLVKIKASIGYMPEHATLWDFLTPLQTLNVLGKAFGMSRNEREKRAEEVLRLLNLWEVKDKKVGKFSKGMKQRLLLAQALINDPELLILDEPMTGLDPTGIAEFKNIIREQRKAGKTVFFSSHILAHVEEVCDTVGIIVKGRLILEDDIENIKREFLKRAGYTIILETNRTVDWSKAPWRVSVLGENKYRIVAPEDIREELHDFVTGQGAKILTMQVKEPSLEEVFLDLVKG
jgi:ABC-2 type transport system ATP-binding protein